MKHYIIYIIALTALTMPAMAQETYESANIATEDVNGTARYVGMGGAMEALGADISTISSNPASIGLFRKSGINFTVGATSLSGKDGSVAKEFKFDNQKSPMSLDQLGFVYAHEYDSGNFLNFGFTYRKSRNFNQILSHTGALNGASLNKIPWQKDKIGNGYAGGYYYDFDENDNLIGYVNETSPQTSECFSQVDYLMLNFFTVDPNDLKPYYYNGKDYLFVRDQKGYIGSYDINISGNQNDRFYWGFTVGIKDVNYSHDQVYRENIVDKNDDSAEYYDLYDTRYISGHGYDFNAGIIFRPIDASPLRIGFSVSTPTFYQLRSNNYTRIDNHGYDHNLDIHIGMLPDANHPPKSEDKYEYKVFTPWKFGVSVGYTIGKEIALGASYTYSDYSSIDNRYITSYTHYDYYEPESANSKSDKVMNHHTKNALQGVSTFKLGAEYKPMPELAIRAGYNYISPMYKTDAQRATCLEYTYKHYMDYEEPITGYYYSSSTDYVNWGATNRFSLGVGFLIDNFTIDVAYQRSMQKGDFHPFETIDVIDDFEDVYTPNKAPAVEVNNNRDQFLITLGYKF